MSRRTRALKKEIAHLNALLDLEAEETLDRVTQYLRFKNVSACERLSIQRDIAQLLLDAEAEGRSVEEVLGTDHEAFCEALIAALPVPTRHERQLMAARTSALTLAFLWFCCFILPGLNNMVAHNAASWRVDVPAFSWSAMPVYATLIGVFVIGFVLMIALVYLNVKLGWSARIYLRWGSMGIVLFILALDYITDPLLDLLPSFMTHQIGSLHIGVCLVVLAALVGGYLWLDECVDNRRCSK